MLGEVLTTLTPTARKKGVDAASSRREPKLVELAGRSGAPPAGVHQPGRERAQVHARRAGRSRCARARSQASAARRRTTTTTASRSSPRAQAKLEVRVIDTGIGIPPQGAAEGLRRVLPGRLVVHARVRRHGARAVDREAPRRGARRHDRDRGQRAARRGLRRDACRRRRGEREVGSAARAVKLRRGAARGEGARGSELRARTDRAAGAAPRRAGSATRGSSAGSATTRRCSIRRARGRPDEDRIVWTIDAQVEGVHFRARPRSPGATWAGARSWRRRAISRRWARRPGARCPRSSSRGRSTMTRSTRSPQGKREAARAVGRPGRRREPRARRRGVDHDDAPRDVRAPARARGAARGDGLWVSGALGLAAAGLAALERKLDVSDDEVARAVLAWRAPRARIAAGLAMRGRGGARRDRRLGRPRARSRPHRAARAVSARCSTKRRSPPTSSRALGDRAHARAYRRSISRSTAERTTRSSPRARARSTASCGSAASRTGKEIPRPARRSLRSSRSRTREGTSARSTRAASTTSAKSTFVMNRAA